MASYPTFTIFRGTAATSNVTQTVYTAPPNSPVLIRSYLPGAGTTLRIDDQVVTVPTGVYDLLQVLEGGKSVSITCTTTTAPTFISGSFVE
jgi:hypothetical protein